MTKQIFSTKTETLDLAPFLTGIFWYKGDSFPAVRVTPENIGLLCLEFEAELEKYGNGNPYFIFHAAREGGADDNSRDITVTLADWIFPRGDELHVWPNPIFEATFSMSSGAHLMAGVATAAEVRANMAWEESEMHETLAGDHAHDVALAQIGLDKMAQRGDITPEQHEDAIDRLKMADAVAEGMKKVTEFESAQGVLNQLKFEVGEKVTIGETGECGEIEEIYEDDRYFVKLLEGDFVGNKYVFSAAQLQEKQSEWLEVGATVLYTHNDFTELVKVEGVEPQDDGIVKYHVRWPNNATSVEEESSLSKLV